MLNKLLDEHCIHKGTVIMYPIRGDVWRKNAYYIQKIILRLISIISKHENVCFCVQPNYYDNLTYLNSENVKVISIDYNDIWARDIMPFIKKEDSGFCGVGFNFNAWDGLYFPYDKDAIFAKKISNILKYKYEQMPLTIEGGAIAYNGIDTIITTENVLLHRNIGKSKTEIESILRYYLSIKRIIWLKNGLLYDETGGHVDNIAKFVSPNTLLLCSDDKAITTTRQHKILSQIESELKPFNFEIIKLQMPRDRVLTKSESQDFIIDKKSKNRLAGNKFSASYINSYVFNGGVIVPVFNSPYDNNAIETYKKIYPNRVIYPIYSKDLLIAGGNFHCILHEYF